MQIGMTPMRLRHIALLACAGLMLAGCNETLETVERDVSHVKNKVDYPLAPTILAEMDKKNMDRNAPIMIRILKEEGKLESLEGATRQPVRGDCVLRYLRLVRQTRTKVKEGDRQALKGSTTFLPAT